MSWLVSFLFRFFNSTVIKFFIIVCWKFCIEESWWQVASGHYWKRTSWWQCDDFFHRHWETWVCLSFSSTQCTIFIDKLASSGSFGKIAQQSTRGPQNSKFIEPVHPCYDKCHTGVRWTCWERGILYRGNFVEGFRKSSLFNKWMINVVNLSNV